MEHEETPIDSYIRIELDAETLHADRLEETFKRFHALRHEVTLDVRLVADERVSYYVGATKRDFTNVEHALHGLFSEGTTITRADPPELPDEPQAALTVYGNGTRRDDWQTRLRPVVDEHARDASDTQFPLAAVVESLARTDSVVHYQALLRPKPNWGADASIRIDDLKRGLDTPAQRFGDFLFGDYSTEVDMENVGRSHKERIHSINAASPGRSFSVHARAVAAGPDAQTVLDAIGSALQMASGEYYRIDPRIRHDPETIEAVASRIDACRIPDPPSLLKRLKRRFPLASNAEPELVTGPATAPNLCMLDGDSLTDRGRRAMAFTPKERTAVPRPDSELLSQYDSGMLLGYPLTEANEPADRSIALPPSMQPLHAAWFGKTGSGKSTALTNAILHNYEATDGADILIDPKDDGMTLEYLKAHYAKYGSLENVYYFDCAETLPAISFFDIREQLRDGRSRTAAVEDLTDHYIEMLVAIMGRERFERAVRSPDIIRYLVKALFDPVHGEDTFAHSDLQAAATRMRQTRDAPPVTDPELQRMLSGVVSNSKRSFDELMQGVANRIEKIPLDDRLARLFNYTHAGDDDSAHFDLREVIDEDAVVIFNTGRLRPESQRVFSLVILSQLWSALQRRTQIAANEDDIPLVNLYLEEAATIAASGLVSDLLAQSRAFGLSMTLAMQFPAQLQEESPDAYAELLNNVSTVVTGNVAVDSDLQDRLATEDMPPTEVANRLRALQRGQWFVSLPSEFGRAEPRPFLVESAPLPAGHPEGDKPLSSARRTAFEAAYDLVRDHSRLEHGIDLSISSRRAKSSVTNGEASSDPEDDAVAGAPDSMLAHTKRLPEVIEYDSARHALTCTACETQYEPTRDGIKRAIECCHTLEAVDRDDIPICSVSTKLTVEERRQSPLTDAQLRFLQAVYAAHQQRFDRDLEYDLRYDSMVRLREYVGIDNEAVDELLEAGLLSKDCEYPHVLYTVTADGRSEVNIKHREGVAYGHGAGDLSESSLHVAMVEVGAELVQTKFVENEQSAAVEVSPYHELESGDGRLDVAGLDENGEVVVTVEAERSNNDTRQAVPADYDKMAGEDPEAAIWTVENRNGGHDVLDALNEPADGPPRIEKTYSRSTATQLFNIDRPGLTEIYTYTYLRDSVLE